MIFKGPSMKQIAQFFGRWEPDFKENDGKISNLRGRPSVVDVNWAKSSVGRFTIRLKCETLSVNTWNEFIKKK